MKIIKKINNNVAVGLDSSGNEVVVFGKGVGYGFVPYELTDLSQIDRTFYDIDKRYYGLLREIPEKTFLLVTHMLDVIKIKINGNLNPNLPFILADHINFALERNEKGLNISIPYSYELEYEHPELIELSKWFVSVVNDNFKVELDEGEVSIIAMHLLNALEGHASDAEISLSQKEISQITQNVTEIIENFFEIHVDQNSFHYLRFKNHLKFFLLRKKKGEEFTQKGEELFQNIKASYPEVYKCVIKIEEYLESLFGRKCPHEEQLYLMLHVGVLCEKEDCKQKGSTPKIL